MQLYKVVDSERGLDLVSGEYLPGCRWAAAPSFSGCPVDPGNLGKVIFDEERMSLVRALQEPGVCSPELPGYVFHERRAEIEYLSAGEGVASYPDGSSHPVAAGDCLFHREGQPHRLLCTGGEGLELCVGIGGTDSERYPGQLGQSRGEWKPDVPYREEGGYRVLPAGQGPDWDGWGPGCQLTLTCESPGLTSARALVGPEAAFAGGFCQNDGADEMTLVVGGEGLLLLPDRILPLRKNTAYYLFAGQPYKLAATGGALELFVYWSVSSTGEIERRESELSF